MRICRFRNRLAATVVAGLLLLVIGTVGAAVVLTIRGFSSVGPWSAVGAVCAFAGMMLRRILGHYYPPRDGRRRRSGA